MKKILFICVLLCSQIVFAQSDSTLIKKPFQVGIASYYSKRSNGARTASGKILYSDSLVCAHRSLPFGTKIKVTNLKNGKSIIVKVIDRGPFAKGRVIDLSYAAADSLNIIRSGLGKVELFILP
jgi:rare lipoprotein A